eukprot:GGOE01019439.1.p1 GENE.GGOE01019439.1~~GGOE01019439.1.p1  ORF type:complete len:284 (-),score=43.54 GGOE01019439.1:363-1214(-)
MVEFRGSQWFGQPMFTGLVASSSHGTPSGVLRGYKSQSDAMPQNIPLPKEQPRSSPVLWSRPRVEGVIIHVPIHPAIMPKIIPPPEPVPGTYTPLLPSKQQPMQARNTLVLDLDETLVHSSFEPIPADHVIPIVVEGSKQMVYVKVRPFAKEFLDRVSMLFEVVLLTASREVYAGPVMDALDKGGCRIHHRLFRDSCANLNGAFVKDLNYLGRPLHSVIIVDNSPVCYIFHPQNALPIPSWFNDTADRELLALLPTLEAAAKVGNVYPVLEQHRQQLGLPRNP